MSNAQQHQKNKTKQQQNVKSTPRKHNIDKLTKPKCVLLQRQIMQPNRIDC